MFHVEHFLKYYFMKISANLVDVHLREIYPAEIIILNGRIERITRVESAQDRLILPGLIDSHIHIESSMITPGAFGLTAVKHGTTGVVSDPHEIANVLGLAGVNYMIEDSKKSPVRFWFGAPSCVPATSFETSGAMLNSNDIEKLLGSSDIKYLSEMMNFPGVIFGDQEVLKKIAVAKKMNKPVDGHAPGLSGGDLKKYVSAGISTDHECSSLTEAKEKISLGMKVLIREGSAAKNLNSLKGLYGTNPEMVMLCSDDLHPEMLEKRHINGLISVLIKEGYDLFDVIRSATVNPVMHYGLEAGLLRVGDSADFIVVGSLEEMNVQETWIAGMNVFDNGKVNFSYVPGGKVNNFNCSVIDSDELVVRSTSGKMRIIVASEGELLTGELLKDVVLNSVILPDMSDDILKIVVKDRYKDSTPAVGYIKGFGIKEGAYASSVSHDSHNIVCVGCNDEDIAAAINEIVKMKGGLSVSYHGELSSLQLDIGGIMTTRSCTEVAAGYTRLSEKVKALGCPLTAPFMTLSFMALLVIPDLKIGDRGLFDVRTFSPVSLFPE
jgi:adenine deaminase